MFICRVAVTPNKQVVLVDSRKKEEEEKKQLPFQWVLKPVFGHGALSSPEPCGWEAGKEGGMQCFPLSDCFNMGCCDSALPGKDAL